jgi:hypothetical protein
MRWDFNAPKYASFRFHIQSFIGRLPKSVKRGLHVKVVDILSIRRYNLKIHVYLLRENFGVLVLAPSWLGLPQLGRPLEDLGCNSKK